MSRTHTLADFYDSRAFSNGSSVVTDDPIPEMDVEYPILQWLWYWLSGDRAADRQADNQDWLNAQEGQRQLDLQTQAAELMPSAQLKGMVNAGFSGAAAASAIAGGASVNAPSFSSGGSSSAPNPSMLNGLLDLVPALMQQKLVNAQASSLDAGTDIAYKRFGLDKKMTDWQIQSIKEQMYNNRYYRELSSRQQDVAEMLADAQIGKTSAEVDQIYQSLINMQADLVKTVTETDLVSNQAVHELIKMSETKQNIAESKSREALNYQKVNESQSATMLNTQLTYESEARTDLVGQQAVGQQLTNDEQRMSNYIKDQRLKISQELGFEVDAPQVTQVLEAMVDGDLNACLKAISASSAGTEGTARRVVGNLTVRGKDGRRRSGRESYYRPKNKSSQHFWNPYPGR